MMKTVKSIFVLICLGTILFSCSKEIETPVACLSAPSTAKVNEIILFEACSPADYYVIWTGDTLHNYDIREELIFDRRNRQIFQAGYPMKNGQFQYMYRTPGTFKVVLVVTNSANNTKVFRQSTFETTIVVEQ